MSPADFQIPPEEMARMEDLIKDKARQQLSLEIGCQLERVCTLLETSHMVIFLLCTLIQD
jgi:hypothetical protein